MLSVALVCMALCYCSDLFSQVKIGNNPSTINPNSALEIESTNKGLLLPRLSLNSTNQSTPLSNFVQGMFIFNTATLNDVSPGIYYSDGSKWIKINADSGLWSLVGNSGTDSTANFLGTTDNMPLLLKTKNAERFRITENGWVGIGTSTPSAALEVKGQMVIDSFSTGNTTDNLVVANPSDGKLKMIPSKSFISGAQKRVEIVSTAGQTIFATPSLITDLNKILLYRNGILITFTLYNSNSIVSEMPCSLGDEIRIIQLK